MTALLSVMSVVMGQLSVVRTDAGQFTPDGGAVEAQLPGNGADRVLGLVKCLELVT
jgi:hypothetical protein